MTNNSAYVPNAESGTKWLKMTTKDPDLSATGPRVTRMLVLCAFHTNVEGAFRESAQLCAKASKTKQNLLSVEKKLS